MAPPASSDNAITVQPAGCPAVATASLQTSGDSAGVVTKQPVGLATAVYEDGLVVSGDRCNNAVPRQAGQLVLLLDNLVLT